mmetsp:Transcript_18089/g.18074  ORF Transcript_18089/g.18074 Transcript_18089/m.18074 type:complete len:1545 (+) Transcript_18089:436-5070(+)
MKKARKFYSEGATREIIDTFRRKICPGGDISEAVTLMTTLIPNKGEVDSWCIDILLEAVEYDHRNLSVILKVIAFLADTAKASPDYNWEPYMPKLLDLSLRAIPLLPNPAPRPKTYMDENKKLVGFMGSFMKKTTGIVKFLIFTLKEQGNSLKYFQQWIQNIRGHLKEEKMTTHAFVEHINKCGHYMSRRIRRANKNKTAGVSSGLINKFLDILLPCVEVVFHTKHLGTLDKLFNSLSFIAPERFISFCTQYCSYILEDYNVSHSKAIEVMRQTLRATLDSKVYNHDITELPLLIEKGLQELTSSDIDKACKVLDYYAVLGSTIALDDSAGDGIREWGQSFMERLLDTLSKLEEKSEEKEQKPEKPTFSLFERQPFNIEKSLKNCMRALSSSVGIDIFYFWVNDFLEYIKFNACNNAQHEFGIIAAEMTRRHPQRVLGNLLELVKNRTIKNGEISSRSPKEISWLVGILASSMKFGGDYLVNIRGQLEELISVFIKNESEKIYEMAGDLIGSYIEGLVTIYPTSYHPFLPSFVDSHMDYNQYRGSVGQQTEGTDMEISWYKPSDAALIIAKELAVAHLFSINPEAAKDELKKKLAIASSVLPSLSTLESVSTTSPGTFRVSTGLENLNIPAELLDSQKIFSETLKSLSSSQLILNDSNLAETLIKLITSALKNNDLCITEIKQEEAKLRMLRNRVGNPLVPFFQKNHSETRIYQIEKAYIHHNMRIATRLSQKRCIEHYQDLLDIIIKLCMHQLKSVRGTAKSSLKKVISNNFLYGQEVIAYVWQKIEEKIAEVWVTRNEEDVKAILEIISEKGEIWKRGVVTKMYLAPNILMQASSIENAEIQIPLFGIFSNYVMTAYPNIKITSQGSIELLEDHKIKGREIIEKMCREIYGYNWRYKLYAMVYIILNIASVADIEFLNAVSDSLTPLILDEHADIRDTAAHLFNFILRLKTYLTLPKASLSALPMTDFSEDTRYLDLSNISTANLGKLHQGWSILPDSIKNYPEAVYTESHDSLYNLLNNEEKVEKLLQFLVVKHQIETEETQISNPAAHSSNHALEFLNNPAKLVNFILEQPIKRKFSKGAYFSVSKANFFKGIGRIYGPSGVRILLSKARSLISQEKESQIVLSEVLAGVFRSMKYWDSQSKAVFYSFFEEVIRNCSLESSGSWQRSIEYICKKQSPHKILPIYRILYSNLSVSASTKLRKILKLLSRFVGYLGWKGIEIYPELVLSLGNLPSDYFASLRITSSILLGKIISATGRFMKNNEETQKYLKIEIEPGKYWGVFKPAAAYITNIQAIEESLYSHLLIEIYRQLYRVQNSEWNLISYINLGIQKILEFLESADSKLSLEASTAIAEIFSSKISPSIFSNLLQLFIKSEGVSWQSMNIKIHTLAYFWYYNQFSVPYPDFSLLFFDPRPETRNTSKSCLALVLKVVPSEQKNGFYSKCLELGKEKDISNKIAYAFGLSSLILSLEEFMEPWKGDAIVKLCRMKREGTEISSCVNSTMADFWKVHKPLWNTQHFREKFTDEAIDVVSGFNSEHSYFA